MSTSASLTPAHPLPQYKPRNRQAGCDSFAFPSPAWLTAYAVMPNNSPATEQFQRSGKTERPKRFAATQPPVSPDKAPQKSGLVGGRTKGMWLFDTLLYPGLTNAAVFAISVLATYATTHGAKGNMMRQRGDATRAWMQKKFNVGANTAKETVMITFSFLDGCVMAPVVKWFEDHRMGVVKRFDRWMGNTPQDPDVYDKEPKQSWGSVLGGRTAAFALVVPTAKLMSIKTDGATSFNDRLFAQPGKKAGAALLQKFPGLQKALPKINIPGLMEVCFMEGFYTAICTAGLYLSSRFLANRHNQAQTHEASAALKSTAPDKNGWTG